MPASPSSNALDLSALPAPDTLAAQDFEAILGDAIADLQARWPQFDTPVDSDPAVKLLQVVAWRELLTRHAIDDAARSTMLAYARGGNLDQIGALLGVSRRMLSAATATEPAVMESDDELRARIQLAPEALPHAGVTGGFYRARALGIAPALKDVAAINRGGGRVDIILLGRDGDGDVPADIVADVAAAFAEDDAVQLTDIVSVRGATILPYDAEIRLTIARGPDPTLVRIEAERAVRAYASRRHAIGRTVYAQQLAAVASVGGVEHATCPLADIVPGDAGAAWLRNLMITVDRA
ncbi:baseplate J/gp47 family protein [uncultured Croceicoccus sp.]|uniref:baseplate assembly protein n=1 Tax=uncultured Croceicoccus sp. TaxID=1295329 RepID=UPI00260DF4CB|nr:baseplate J/gp47 family protein [uncultured Croceicoccus sp.]